MTTPAASHPVLLDHVGLTCADLDASVAFYRDLLDLPVLSRGEGPGQAAGIPGALVAFAQLDAGRGQMIELLEYRRPRSVSQALPVSAPGGTHVALRIRDLEQVLDRLAEASCYPLTDGPVTVHAPGTPWDGARLVYVPDPDQHIVELVQFA
jgi:catechol 2,3-dioxygenase-like lactoylglutathione lyase family enzyme